MNEYENIINLPHHKSETRPNMPIADRAAQFAPFAALTGHSEAVKETARVTDKRIELDECAKEKLNEKLRLLQARISDNAEAEITYFVPDERKQGGAYVTVIGSVKRIKEFERTVIMRDETVIPVDEILSIESEMFSAYM